MQTSKSRVKDLKVGDLVTHLLYGKEWVGIVLGFREDENPKTLHNEKTLVQVQPGTQHEFFFRKNVSKKNRISDNMGYVSTNWLFKLSEDSS